VGFVYEALTLGIVLGGAMLIVRLIDSLNLEGKAGPKAKPVPRARWSKYH
jgi:hypothetical protein